MHGLILFLLLSLWAVMQPVLAQTQTDTLRLDLASYGLTGWQTANNAATLIHWRTSGYGITQATATLTDGTFRRPQEPARQMRYGLSSEGLRLVNKWAFYGDFSYQKTVDKGIGFSHGYDPFNGNPYLWADTLAGNPDAGRWLRDHIRATVAVASPLLGGRWRLGLTLPYHVGQGARLLEPKPFYRFREIGALPSVWYTVSARWGLGFVGGGRFVQEENEVGRFSIDFPLLYSFRGYGSFSRTPVSSAERQLNGTTWQGTLQTRFQRNPGPLGASWFAQAGGARRQETIREGIATPVFGGAFAETQLHGLLAYTHLKTGGGSRVMAEGDYRQGVGTDPILRSVGASYTQLTARIQAGRWKQKADRFSHDFLSLTLHSFANNDQLTRTDFSGLSLTPAYDGLRRWAYSDKRAMWLGLRAGYSWFPSATFQSARPTFLTTSLTRPDFTVQTTSHARVGFTMGYEWAMPRQTTLWHRIELHTDAQFADRTGQPHRLRAELCYQLRYL